MIGIKCKGGNVFSATIKRAVDAEWKLEEAYYKAQGCEVIESKDIRLGKCSCEHCGTLEHNFHELLDEIMDNR